MTIFDKMIERIRLRKEHKTQEKRLQEFLKADLKDLQAKGEYILSLCLDNLPLKDPNIIPSHHLPLKNLDESWNDPTNWDLTDEQIEIVNTYRKDLMHYASLVISCYKKVQTPEPMLPLWLVFPTYSATSLGWRMGMGESYEFCYNKMLNCMDDEARQAYMQKFPAPAYMKLRCYYWLYQKWESEKEKQEFIARCSVPYRE